MTAAPVVELGFNPTELRPQDLPRAGAFLGSPAEALEAALAVTRAAMVDQLKAETRGLAEPTQAQLLRIADLAWQAVAWRFRKISAPVLADAYIRTYRAADAGDVPMSVIYELADRHAEKIGEYFHASSREALAEGFTLQVNRRLPAKAAANTVLEAYGLAPRQMRSYVTTQFNTPISDVLPRSLKAKARAYVDKSFTSRIRKLSAQEEHNIDQQAKQLAWMWLQDKGRLPTAAQKMWLTAKDEKTCPVCAPLHGKKVGVNERFVTSQGEFWTPGLHPNCRCRLRLLEHTFTKSAFGTITKADFDPSQHPRGGDPENRGRFSSRPGPRFKEREDERPIFIPPIPEVTEEPARVPMEKPKVSLEKPKVSLAATPGTGERVSLAGKVGLASNEQVQQTEQKVSLRTGLAKPRAELGSGEVKARVRMLTSPDVRVGLARQLAHAFSLHLLGAPPRPRPKKRFYKGTLKIQDEHSKPYPVYAVLPRGSMDENNQLEMTHETLFVSSWDRLADYAEETFRENVDDVAESVMENGWNRLQIEIGGRRGFAELDVDEVANIVTWRAYQGRVDDSDFFGGDPLLEVDVLVGGGHITRQYRYSQLASHLGVEDDDFDIRVVRLDEGHFSHLGETAQLQAETRHGDAEWATSGLYRGALLKDEPISHNLSLKVYQLEPEAEEVAMDSPFD